jgi:O-antigen ligase
MVTEANRMQLAQTGQMKIHEQLLLCIVYLPLIMTATVLFWLPKGANLLPYGVGVSLVASLYLFGRNFIIDNITKNSFVWILTLYSLYAIFSYYHHGHSSRELRAILTCLLFSLSINKIISINFFTLIAVIASIGIVATLVIQNFYLSISRISAFTNPNIYVLFSATISIFLLSLSIHYTKMTHKILLYICFILTLIATFMTGSRGTSLSLLIAIFVILLFDFKKISLYKFKFFFIASLIAIIFGSITFLFDDRIKLTWLEAQRIQSGEMETPIGIRFQLWSSALSIFKSSPLLGKGRTFTDDMKELYDHGKISYPTLNQSHIHNQFLDILVKKGLIGLFLFLWLFIFPIVTAFKKEHEAWRKSCVLGIFIIFFISGIFDVQFIHAHTIYVYFVFLSSIIAFTPFHTHTLDNIKSRRNYNDEDFRD